MKYEIEVTSFEARLTSHQFETTDPSQAAHFIGGVLEPICCVIVAAIDCDVDRGNFILWLANERALVRLDAQARTASLVWE